MMPTKTTASTTATTMENTTMKTKTTAFTTATATENTTMATKTTALTDATSNGGYNDDDKDYSVHNYKNNGE